MSIEQWLPITHYEAFYEVSSHGRIRSHDRVIVRSKGSSYLLPGRIMKTRLDRDGYELVTLNDGHKARTFKTHRLVAQEFIPNPEGLPQVDHDDGIRNHNKVGNLAWSTISRNLSKRHNIKRASGFKGVRLQSRPRGDRYQAYAHDLVAKRFIHIGVFDTAELAASARSAYIAGNPNASSC